MNQEGQTSAAWGDPMQGDRRVNPRQRRALETAPVPCVCVGRFSGGGWVSDRPKG